MISLEQWRAVIGCFRPTKSGSRHNIVSNFKPTRTITLLIVVSLTLMLCGDVELNPGPPRKANRQTTLSVNGSINGSINEPTTPSPSTPSQPYPTNLDIMTAIGQLTKKMDNLAGSFEDLNAKVCSLTEENRVLREWLTEVKKENKVQSDKIAELRLKLDHVQQKLDDQEAHSRRNNLLLHGLHQQAHETWEDTELNFRKFVSEKLGLNGDEMKIDRAHRLHTTAKTSPIIVRFSDYKDREKILKARGKLKNTEYSIREDFTLKVRNIRKRLSPFVDKYRQEGKRATIVYDHMIVDGRRYDLDHTTGTPQPKQRSNPHTAASSTGTAGERHDNNNNNNSTGAQEPTGAHS